MADRPSEFLNWIPDDTTNIIEPTTGQKNTGWLVGQKPPAQFTNWQINLIDQWLQYFDQVSAAWPNFFADTELQLADAIAGCNTAGGGVICIRSSFTINTSKDLPKNTIMVGRGGQSVMTIGGSAVLTAQERSILEEVNFRTSKTSGDLVQLQGTGVIVRDCDFGVDPTNASLVCLSVAGDACIIEDNIFRGVASPSMGVGIEFEIGYADSVEEDNIFTP